MHSETSQTVPITISSVPVIVIIAEEPGHWFFIYGIDRFRERNDARYSSSTAHSSFQFLFLLCCLSRMPGPRRVNFSEQIQDESKAGSVRFSLASSPLVIELFLFLRPFKVKEVLFVVFSTRW